MKHTTLALCAVTGLALFSGCGNDSSDDTYGPGSVSSSQSSSSLGASVSSASLSSVASSSSEASSSSAASVPDVLLSSGFRTVRYMVDLEGMSLYTFDNDAPNVSNCPNIEGCVETWPAFTASITENEDFGTIDGMQTTYLGHPLYYFINDAVPGDVKGDGVKEVWHLVYPNTDFTETSEAKLSPDARIQTFLTDAEGMALYTFDNDDVNVSNCYETCEQIWPVVAGNVVTDTLPAGVDATKFGTTERKDGSIQATYDGAPLYYFAMDLAAGDTNGDWVNGIWHLIELGSEPVDQNGPVVLGAKTRDINYMVDADGLSLYTFDADEPGVSNCPNIEGCVETWPAFTAVIDREDFGSTAESQTTYFQHPLYYFINDAVPGDVKGDGVKEVWHLVYPKADFVETSEAKRSTAVRAQTYLTDKDGRALYTFDNDDVNVSNCYGMCEQIWPVYYDVYGSIAEASYDVPAGLDPSDFSLIERDSNRSEQDKQIAYKGQPLYYYINDTLPDDTNGDWVNGVWHLIEINATTVDEGEPVATGDVAKGQARFAQGCNNCHGDDGRTSALGVSRIIADIDDAAVVKDLLTYLKNDGTGKHSAMVGVAQGLSDEEIDNLSAFIATLP